MKLSDKIRIIRKARGLSQEALGNSLSRVNKDGISRQTVSDWENGNTEPKLENIRNLAQVLNVSFDALLDESIDLNNQDVLNRVLKNTSKEVKQSVNSSFSYNIYMHKFKLTKRFVKKLIINSLLMLILIGSGIGGIFLIATKGAEGWGMVMMIFGFGVGSSFLGRVLSLLIYFFKKDQGIYIGTLNQSYLIIKAHQETDNTLYIPIEKIQKMELANKGNKTYDDVIIHVEKRASALTICDIENATKLVEIFNNLGSYIENPDGIKIL